MMANPSLSKLLENPDFLETALQMLKGPAAKPQLEALAKQTGMSEQTILRGLDAIVKIAKLYTKAKPILPLIKYGAILLIVLLIGRFFGII